MGGCLLIKLFLYIVIIISLLSCSFLANKKIIVKPRKIERFYLKATPIMNSSELTAVVYQYLDAFVEYANQHREAKINVISYRDGGNNEYLDNRNCEATSFARDYLVSQGIPMDRITYLFGHLDKSYQNLPNGKTSRNCWLEIQVYYPKK